LAWKNNLLLARKSEELKNGYERQNDLLRGQGTDPRQTRNHSTAGSHALIQSFHGEAETTTQMYFPSSSFQTACRGRRKQVSSLRDRVYSWPQSTMVGLTPVVMAPELLPVFSSL
jgi:hypothetical protein